MDSIGSTALEFRSLFRGREDAWGGEIDPLGEGRAIAIKHPMTLLPWCGHLFRSHPIGIYNAMDGDVCWWSAIDFDDDDYAKAIDAAKAYALFGASPWVERSRRKGWHVWIFHTAPVPLHVARSAGLGVLNLLELDPKTEVYPKQIKVSGIKYGNFLRLPYPAVDEDNGMHRKIVLEGEALSRDEFLGAVQRTSQGVLERLGEFAPVVVPLTATRAAQLIEASMSGQVFASSHQQVAAVAAGSARVPEGQRDTTFYTLARFLHGVGRTREEAESIIMRVHATQTDDPGTYGLGLALAKLNRVYP